MSLFLLFYYKIFIKVNEVAIQIKLGLGGQMIFVDWLGEIHVVLWPKTEERGGNLDWLIDNALLISKEIGLRLPATSSTLNFRPYIQ